MPTRGADFRKTSKKTSVGKQRRRCACQDPSGAKSPGLPCSSDLGPGRGFTANTICAWVSPTCPLAARPQNPHKTDRAAGVHCIRCGSCCIAADWLPLANHRAASFHFVLCRMSRQKLNVESMETNNTSKDSRLFTIATYLHIISLIIVDFVRKLRGQQQSSRVWRDHMARKLWIVERNLGRCERVLMDPSQHGGAQEERGSRF